ncbi:MAG: hypothetical protein AAFY31_13355 [Pseudomonadota bacterium]
MCTMVYVGSTQPFGMGPPVEDGAVAPAPAKHVPQALRAMPHVAMLPDWHEGKPYCSCVFIEQSLPWEPVEEGPETSAAFKALRRLAELHGADLRIFAADDDQIDLAPNVHCRLAPEHIAAGMILFNVPFSGSQSPRVFVEIVPGLARPEKPETLD